MSDTERQLRLRLSQLAPEGTALPGFDDPEARVASDRLLRDAVCAELVRLQTKMEELMAAADEEGEEDMRDDLQRIRDRMERTAGTLSAAGTPAGMSRADLTDSDRETLGLYDLRLLEDMELLSRDVMGMKYETIGTLTLREVEGTLAAIELKVVNRTDVLPTPGGN